jgi:hypothetical protein
MVCYDVQLHDALLFFTIHMKETLSPPKIIVSCCFFCEHVKIVEKRKCICTNSFVQISKTRKRY